MSGSDKTTGGLSAGASKTPSKRTPQPLQAPLTEEQLRAAHVGEFTPLNGSVQIADYHPEWPRLFEREAERIRRVLGNRVLLLEHVGSTSVPGLAAKPRIDILLVVADSADESAYIPPLEAAAYVLHIRESDWYEHRLFKGPDTAINLHVFSDGCPEIDRMRIFRDWLLHSISKLVTNTPGHNARCAPRRWFAGPATSE